MNYFSYYKQLMENLLPVKDGVSITRYHKAQDINMSATRTGFEEFAGRKFTDEQFKDLILLCRNATEKGSYAIWTQPKFTEDGYFVVSKHGNITRIK